MKPSSTPRNTIKKLSPKPNSPEFLFWNETAYAIRLLELTKNCRPDMHEPDEQGVGAMVSQGELDNAMGDGPNNETELVVHMWRDNPDGHSRVNQSFNLASLIALARVGAELIVEARDVMERAKNLDLSVVRDYSNEAAPTVAVVTGAKRFGIGLRDDQVLSPWLGSTTGAARWLLLQNEGALLLAAKLREDK